MSKYIKSFRRKVLAEHGETDTKQSWYWSVLLKNYKTAKKAKQAIRNSRLRIGEYV